jgi:hypothetical protein
MLAAIIALAGFADLCVALVVRGLVLIEGLDVGAGIRRMGGCARQTRLSKA